MTPTGVRDWLLVGPAVFFLNLGWETAHSAMYAHAITAWRYLQAAMGDVLLVA